MKGWEVRKLGEVATFRGGGTPPKENAAFWAGNIPWVSPKDMKSNEISSSIDNITQEAIENSATSLIPQGAILIVVRSGILARTVPLAITTRSLTVNQDIKAICPKNVLDSRFLLYFMSRSEAAILQFVTQGATVHRIETDSLRKIQVPIPPLPEQRRIVAILDEAFAGLETMRANAEMNLQNAREIFDSYLSELFTRKGEGWITRPLGECFRLKSGDGLTSKMMIPGEYSVFGGNGVAGTHNECNLSGDNVIIGRVGALCGNARHVTNSIWLTDNAFKVVDRKYEFDSAFLTYLLNLKNLRSFARQSAQPVISNSSLQELLLEFPISIKDQQKIASEFDDLRDVCASLSKLYSQKLTAIAELKQSLLQKAFSGQLTASESLAA